MRWVKWALYMGSLQIDLFYRLANFTSLRNEDEKNEKHLLLRKCNTENSEISEIGEKQHLFEAKTRIDSKISRFFSKRRFWEIIDAGLRTVKFLICLKYNLEYL